MGGQDKRDPWTQEVNEGLARMKSWGGGDGGWLGNREQD